jgi:hypothetical protein
MKGRDVSIAALKRRRKIHATKMVRQGINIPIDRKQTNLII